MADRAWVATRKGLFELRRKAGRWSIDGSSFLGEPVSMMLPPTAGLAGSGSGKARMLAALNLGHFGVKLHASDDAGVCWTELPAPVYPPQPEGAPGPAWTLSLVWSLEAARGILWAGTLPGGLFRSEDAGQSWALVQGLWNVPERVRWMGGGYDSPGIHSICPHPDRASELLVGISCGGAWTSRDDDAAWDLTARGMVADFMPPEQAEDGAIQDPHRIVRCAAQPEVLWCPHHGGIWRSSDAGASWQRITSAPLSSFGFAVAAHPQDPLTAWFVPAIAGHCRPMPTNAGCR